MSLLTKLKEKGQGIVDIFMPYDGDEYEELEEELAASKSKPVAQPVSSYREELKVANGGSVNVERPSFMGEESSETSRPQLTVHTNKAQELKVEIYAPTNFDEVTAVADALRAGKGCVVNYERIDEAEQCRICDFVNGVCYVSDGTAKKISAKIFLYVPAGIDVTDATTLAMPY